MEAKRSDQEIGEVLRNPKDGVERRWYVNTQGQTFALIDGPAEFQMGSRGIDPDHDSTEYPLRIAMPRRYALASKEVTVEEFQRFLKATNQSGLGAYYMKRFSPEPEGPSIGANWYMAARYCNWLSEQEGIAEDQWCYLANQGAAFAEGMTIPANVLDRIGYRLPTEAEWEYACRAGTVTSRYYGNSIELLSKYGWYQAQSQDRDVAGRQSAPNDLGMFDMLGNVDEWCQDSELTIRPMKKGIFSDVTSTDEIVNESKVRMIRGGIFSSIPRELRSAFRTAAPPREESIYVGFRVARTHP